MHMEEMNPAWLMGPVTLHSSREFTCDGFTEEQCAWYMQRWHFWYIADLVFSLPTIGFFMCAIGIFIIGHVVSSIFLGYRVSSISRLLSKPTAAIRYLSYRGFHLKSLKWNSAPIGVLLLGFAGTLFFFLFTLIPQPYYWPSLDFGGSPPLATRAGWLALACMPFVFATASKTNWITLLTGVSHERLQVFHRWISYAFFVLALIHTFPFIVYHIRWHDMESHFASSLVFYWTGIVALIFQAWLTFASHSTIRNLGYEFFKITHFIAVVIFMITFFWHCGFTLSSWDYFIGTAAVYVPCFIYPWLRTCFEYGLCQKAEICAESNGFIRITIPANFHWEPGHHFFLRFTSFGFLNTISAHPFTVCSLPSTRPDEPSQLVFYVRRQGGFTAKLYDYAVGNPCALVPVQVDGPYGGINLRKYHNGDEILVIAGGSGAGWCLPFLEKYLRSSASGSDEEHGLVSSVDRNETPPSEKVSKTKSHITHPLSIRVILSTRDLTTRIWFLQQVDALQSRAGSQGKTNIRVQVYLTGEAAQHKGDSQNIQLHPTSSTDSSSNDEDDKKKNKPHTAPIPTHEFEGRPGLPAIITEEAEKGRTLSVYVCGPTTMQNDVRNAVAGENLKIVKGGGGGGVYLHSEHFEWA
ncbi:hypothetical protein HYALB_00009514 [Hymenoscyphus albidus]|uniref:ferric-chelate reductase (NADPH) n=1 Tax=Hymenoscyphus albidus TaxID=595503 RepID=A0A9N9PUB8_9HELO|nr:hypothetical protein HYALB_00009514 [Hymenoscyphus albidus]